MKAEPKIRTWKYIVYLGGDPRQQKCKSRKSETKEEKKLLKEH